MTPPRLAHIVRPDLCPPECLLKLAAEGLQLLGLERYASLVRDGREVKEATRAVETVCVVLNTAKADPYWIELAFETRRYLAAIK